MNYPWRKKESSVVSKLWKNLAVLMLIFALTPTVSMALTDCQELKVANFSHIENKTPGAEELQRAVLIAYTDVDTPALDKLTDGYIGSVTVKEFIRFCEDINLPPGNDIAERLVDALKEFIRISSKYPEWLVTIGEDEFVNWTDTLCDNTYGGFFSYSRMAPLRPGGAFLFADYYSRKTITITDSSSDHRWIFSLEEEDFETLKNIGNIDGLLGTKQMSRTELRGALTTKLAATGSENDALIESLVSQASCRTNYQLEDQASDELLVAGLPAQMLLEVSALQELSFESKSTLFEQIDKLTNKLYNEYVAILSDAEAINLAGSGSAAANTTDQSEEGAPTSAPPSIELQRAHLRAKGLPTPLVESLPAGNLSEKKLSIRTAVNQYGRLIRETIKSTNVFSISNSELSELSTTNLASAIPEEILTRLAPLQGVRFPNEELLRAALRLTADIGPSVMMDTIVNVAHKPGLRVSQEELQLAPIKWGTSSCGCGVFETLDQEYPSHLYGIYPYWQVPKAVIEGADSEVPEPESIDFSMLDRIAYYGITINANGSISQPLHFQQKQSPTDGWFWQREDYSDFVKRAHQYKTKIDLVVYNSNWESWLRKKEDSGAFEQDFTQPLIENIHKQLSIKLEGIPNKIKPVISFGFSPARTLGDGVTFDFNFRDVKAEDQTWLFEKLFGGEGFLEQLDKRLNDATKWPRKVRYSTNLIVPIECLIVSNSVEQDGEITVAPPGCGLYSAERLTRMTHIDRFLIDMSSGGGEFVNMERILVQIAKLDVERRLELLRKIVPLATPNVLSEFSVEQLSYVDWNFSGIGSWNLIEDEKTREIIKHAFIGSHIGTVTNETGIWHSMSGALQSLESTVCNFACPIRWLLRTIVFLVAIISTIYAIASYWFFSFRKLYRRKVFTWGVALITALLVLTLWCDPFWSKHKPGILFACLLATMIVWFISRQQKLRESYYP